MKHAVIWSLAGMGVVLLTLFMGGPSSSSEFNPVILKTNLDLPYNAAAAASDEDEEAPEIVVFYGSMYEASAIVFCLDESLSMRKAGRWETQKKEINRTIMELSTQAEFGIVFYGAGSYSFRNNMMVANQGSKQAAIKFVNSRQMTLGTCLGPGVVKSLRMLQRSQSRHRAVIVSGDGRPTSCPFVRGSGRDPAVVRQVLQQTLAANPGRVIRVHTVLVGNDVTARDTDFMQTLARLHRGTYRRVVR